MLVRTTRLLAIGALAFGLAASAHAGPAMFDASFIMHSFGNDITTGTASPYTTSDFTGMPLGNDCQHASPYTLYGAPYSRYCTPQVMRDGVPATGMGTLSVGSGSVASIMMPQSAFGVTVTGFLPTYYPYLQSNTYATFVNAAGTFFAGGGPAAGLGQKIKTGMGQTAGGWVVNEGANGFGGAMGLLGKLGAKAKYVVPGVAGTYEGTGTWNMIVALGRDFKATPTAFTPMGKANNWLNPHIKSQVYINNYNGKGSTLQARGTGTRWTTGSVTLYATAGVFTTILHRAGYDTVTSGGARNIQLVTPALTHWIGPGYQTHTGHIGILNMQLAPEPGAVMLLAVGGAVMALLYRVNRRR